MRAIDKRDSFFVVKYASLGQSHRPITKVIKYLRILYKLKWLHPCVVFSHHTNLQEKLLGDIWRKVCWGVVDADLAHALATVHESITSMESAPTAASTSCAALPEAYTKFCVMLVIVIVSTLVNLNGISRHASKNI
jgi:hypothetical protein